MQNRGFQGFKGGPPLPLSSPPSYQPFDSNQNGRYQYIPLPGDFMINSNDKNGTPIPSQYQPIGRINGVVIRDPHGNLGLSQYSFSTY